MESFILRKKTKLTGYNLTRHRAVQAFFRYRETKKEGETRESMSLSIARCFGKGVYFARMIVTWEREWIAHRERQVGCFAKTRSWLNDEGVQLHVREWLEGAKEILLDMVLQR